MTAGDIGRTAEKQDPDLSHGQLTHLDSPGGDTDAARQDDAHAAALDGPFTTRQLLRLDEALRIADQATGLVFSVYLGELDEPVRAHAEKLHGQLADPARAVLIAVSPNQRLLEIVTGSQARKRITDRQAKVAAMSMAASFGGGDLAGGVISGLDQLATQAGKH
ncbi:hypothetical protein Sya03_52890 [Spirilliplanes yamanashiensis]|uniref:Uncharacterized protein n=1 Tax=Spirilliplanes yamanashiensis TaxID=42233 RepID=A0A8J4DL24_9ACTN|nr:hypothetical protein [Spirilliplanes yamanashiensis]GIJ05937.1 hypothetical protein Sya03_52890 [Spirilliplanes yamanashiensis]